MRRDSVNRPLKETTKTSKMTSSRSIANRRTKINKVWVAFAVFGAISILRPASGRIVKRSYSDQSVRGYLTERTCWWNEVCKEEFQQLFRCRCPQWSYCRSPGRYYNAYCSMTNTGYIWTQPTWDWETA